MRRPRTCCRRAARPRSDPPDAPRGAAAAPAAAHEPASSGRARRPSGRWRAALRASACASRRCTEPPGAGLVGERPALQAMRRVEYPTPPHPRARAGDGPVRPARAVGQLPDQRAQGQGAAGQERQLHRARRGHRHCGRVYWPHHARPALERRPAPGARAAPSAPARGCAASPRAGALQNCDVSIIRME
jgi:hypothetical protein